MAEVLKLDKPLIFACGKVVVGGGPAERVSVERGSAFNMMVNCAFLVDVEAAQCAVQADRERELGAIGEHNFGHINRTVQAALNSGAVAMAKEVAEVDAYNCGEPDPMRALPAERVGLVFRAAAAAGQLEVLMETKRMHGEAVWAYLLGNGYGGEGRWMPMWEASHGGRLAVVEWLLGECGLEAGATEPKSGASAVSMAAQSGYVDVVRTLLNAGASMDQADGQGGTLLSIAITNGDLAVVRLLVEEGASVDQTTGTSVLDLGTMERRGCFVSPLYIATDKGHLAVVHFLLEQGASVDQPADEGSTPLAIAARQGFEGIVRLLLEKGASVKQAANSGATPLLCAAENGHLAVVDVLAEKGASLEQATNEGFTPLLSAIQNGHLAVVRFLLEQGASVGQAVNAGVTPLYIAAQGGFEAIVGVLVEKGASVDQAAVRNAATPLFISAMQGHLAVVRFLLEQGASVDRAADDGQTPLYMAAMHGHLAVVGLLLEQGASVDQAKNGGGTPLYTAAQQGFEAVVDVLVEKGASMDQATNNGWSPLLIATHKGHLAVVRFLLEQGASVDQATNAGGTPLYVAVRGGFEAVVRVLVENGASVDQATNDGQTPLYAASQLGFEAVVRLLLKKGASANQRRTPNDGDNSPPPLFMAAGEGHLGVVRALLEAGADKSVKVLGRFTALQVAQVHGHQAVADFIMTHQAPKPKPAEPVVTEEAKPEELSEHLMGKRVLLHGLGLADMNGRSGVVTSLNHAARRYVVSIRPAEGSRSRSSFQLKALNLMVDLTGKRVVIHGTSRDDMNGRLGMATTFDAKSGRYAVRVDSDGEGRTFRLKPANVSEDVTEALRRAIKWYPLLALRTAIAQAQESQQTVEAAVLAQARERARDLATEKLRSVMGRRQLGRLRDATAEAEATAAATGLVDPLVLSEAHKLTAVLQAEPGAAEAPEGTHAMNELIKPAHIDEDEVRCVVMQTPTT